MMGHESLEYYMTNIWYAIDDAKVSIKELEHFIDSMEDEDYRETLKAYCTKMNTEINNVAFYTATIDGTLDDIRKEENNG